MADDVSSGSSRGAGGPSGEGADDSPPRRDRRAEMAALVRTIQEDVERREEAVAVERRRRSRNRRIVYPALGLALVLNILVLVAPPSWVIPPPPEPPTAEEEELALRLAVYLQGQKLKAYERDNGRFPPDLQAVRSPGREGEGPFPGVEFQYRTTPRGTFELLGEKGLHRVVYTSIQDPEEFLGGAWGVLVGSVPGREE